MSKPTKQLLLGVSLAFVIAQQGFAAQRIIIEDNQSLVNTNPLQVLGQDYQFKIINKTALPNGIIKHKYQQYYQGIPIWNNNVVSDQDFTKPGSSKKLINNTNLSGSYLGNVEQDIVNVQPTLSSDDAIKKATAKNSLIAESEPTDINSRLFIKEYSGTAKLIYIIDYYVDGANQSSPSRPYFEIDAHTGEILDQWEGLTTLADDYVKATGPGGNEKVGKYFYGKDYGYLIVSKKDNKCQMDSPNVQTLDFKNKPDWLQRGNGGDIHEFDCNDENSENNYKEINGGYSPINDAHYFGNVVFDMYKEWYNTAPLTFKLILKVHYRKSYENAAWTGKFMLFGDGSTTFHPLVSLDVIAHEVSHGFTQQNSDLAYKKQSGGMNESFSDIAGEAAKYFFNMDKTVDKKNDWMVGASIIKGEKENALRYFADPTRDKKSIDHADKYKATTNVHYSSGVFNKAFYTLATTSNWDLKKAFDVFVLANKSYWTQDSTFDEGGCGVKKAAADFGFSTDDVINAFKVVGVNATCKKEEPKDPDPKDPTDPKDPQDPKDPKDPQDPKDPGKTPAPEDAVKLSNGLPHFGVSADAGESKLFYLDITKENAKVMNAWFWGGMGKPSMQIAYNRVPTTNDADCDTTDKRNAKTCGMKSPVTGRYFIKLFSKEGFDNVTLWTLTL